MKVSICVSGEGNNEVVLDLTEKQFKFLEYIMDELFEHGTNESYSPSFFVRKELKEKVGEQK